MSGPDGIFNSTAQLLEAAIERVTGSPSELRAKAQECTQCANDVDAAANDTKQIVINLGQGWNGAAYDAAKDTTDKLIQELINVLKQNLQQEAQRLNSSAEALTGAKQNMEQEKQDFEQIKQMIMQIMQAMIQAAMGSPNAGALIAAAIAQAVMKAIQLMTQKQQSSQQIEKQLSSTFSQLYSQQNATTSR